MKKLRKFHIYFLGGVVFFSSMPTLGRLVENDFLYFAIVIAFILLLKLIIDKFGRP